jgi:hypothetical protein
LSVAKGRPNSLFPALKRLSLFSTDNLSLFIAFQVLPRIISLCISLEYGEAEFRSNCENTLALLSAAADSAQYLTSIELNFPFDNEVIKAVSQVSSLTSLFLDIDHTVTDATLSMLDHLRALEKLHIFQRQANEGNAYLEQDPGPPFPPSVTVEMGIHTSRVSNLLHLRDMKVDALGVEQFRLATTISPNSLKTLELDAYSGDNTPEIILIPLAITIYSERNPCLTSLLVSCPKGSGRFLSDLADPFRAVPRYTSTVSFIKALTSLRNLTTLRIIGAPFFSVSIVVDILKVLPSMPQLEIFKFIPEPVSARQSDKLELPSLGLLEKVSRYNSRLKSLSVLMNVSDIPSPPEIYASTHGLESLWLGPSLDGIETPYSLDWILDIARYLDSLFPHFKPLSESPSWVEVSELQKGWNGVGKVVLSYQQLRARVSVNMRLASNRP